MILTFCSQSVAIHFEFSHNIAFRDTFLFQLQIFTVIRWEVNISLELFIIPGSSWPTRKPKCHQQSR